jgi:hypothetical protein
VPHSEEDCCSLEDLFHQNEKEDLSMAERNALKKLADSIFETYGR